MNCQKLQNKRANYSTVRLVTFHNYNKISAKTAQNSVTGRMFETRGPYHERQVEASRLIDWWWFCFGGGLYCLVMCGCVCGFCNVWVCECVSVCVCV